MLSLSFPLPSRVLDETELNESKIKTQKLHYFARGGFHSLLYACSISTALITLTTLPNRPLSH